MANVLEAGRTAVITGGASGIGLAAAKKYASVGMSVCIADVNEDDLTAAAAELGDAAHARRVDVSDFEAVCAWRDEIVSGGHDIAIVMNNAGISVRSGASSELEGWQKIMRVNLWGVINGVHAFVPGLVDAGKPAAVINTGSKQGITNPPGNPAYNVAKAGVRSLTESLAHELRGIEGCQVTAHLLVPGFTYTGLIRRFLPEKPDAAWTSEQVVDRLIEGLGRGDFYILCPDNDVSVELDYKRLQWNTDDIIENRPALSRWHPDYAEAYERFVGDA